MVSGGHIFGYTKEHPTKCYTRSFMLVMWGSPDRYNPEALLCKPTKNRVDFGSAYVLVNEELVEW